MSKLQELIDRLCPNGVEFKSLSAVMIPLRKGTLKISDLIENGKYPVINSGRELYGYYDRFNNEAPAITIAARGEYAGWVSFFEERFWAGGLCYPYKSKDETKVATKFIYYWLKNQERDIMDNLVARGSIPALNKADIDKYSIPIPPLEVQDEIVKILDRFSDYAAKLQVELQARRLQYEYYRNLLLTFNSSAYSCGTDDAQKISVIARGGHSYEIQWKTMGEIGKFFGGLTGKSKADFSNGNARFISYMNVYSNIALDQSANEFVSILPDEKQNVLQYGDALFTGSSETPNECGMSSVVTTEPKEPLYLNSFSFGFRLDNISTYHPDFLKHLLRSTAIRDQIAKTANGVTRFNVSKALFAKIILPIPPIELQVKIASILDRFETLVNDLSKGLPAEIEAVKARYEYYRNKLLTFNPLSA